MAFPVVLNTSNPPQSESPSLGASRIRALVQNLVDLFNLPAGANISGPLTITRVGPYTNNSGVTLSSGDVVALDTAADSSVVLSDVQASLRQFVVALATITNASTGVFGQTGQVTVTTQGVVTRGNYLRKSATTKALEDTGVAQAAATSPPAGAVGVALTASAGGAATVVAQMFGSTVGSVATGASAVRGLVGANNSGTPNTQFDLAADLVALRSPADGSVVVRTNTGTITNNISTAQAANGRDQAGAFTASTFVHFYFIWNGTTLATLSSATAPPTGPTLPTGYTHWAYAGAVRFNATPLLVLTKFRGASVWYDLQQAAVTSGAPAADAETSVDLSAFVPANASLVVLNVWFQLNGDQVSGFNFNLRTVTGLNQAFYRSIIAVAAGVGAVQSDAQLPNVGQALFYLWHLDAGAGSAPSANIFVKGWRSPNGDS